MKRSLTVLLPALLFLTACGGGGSTGSAPPAGDGVMAGGGGSGSVAISNTGDLDPDPDGPLPIGTTFTFDGWTATLVKVEHSTQDSPSATNPRAAVIQAELELTAPEESEADYEDRAPLVVQARTNGSDMVPCGTDEPYTAFSPGETRTVTTCVAYAGSDEVAQQTPIVSVVARYGGSNQVASVEVASTRGPDY